MITTKVLRCPHGNLMSKLVEENGKVSSFFGGLPKCCRDEMLSPAIGEGFVILNKLIHTDMYNNRTLIDKEKE